MIIGLLLFSFPLEGAASQHVESLRHVYLTWQHDPCTTMTVNVHGIKTPTELTLYYDKKPQCGRVSGYRYKVSAKGVKNPILPDGRRIYHIEMHDLEPGTTYFFSIGNGNRIFGEEYSFKTIPERSERLVFVEGGDWENTPSAEQLTKKAAEFNPCAVILGGDYPSNVYGTNDYGKWDFWLDVYEKNMKTSCGCLIPLVMAIGNHEVIGGFAQPREQVPFFFHYFRQGNTGKSFFSLPFGEKIRLFVLDSGHTEAHEGAQLTWLRNELEKNRDIPIKIAIYHVPIFPSVRFAERDLIFHSMYGFIQLWKSKRMAKMLFSRESSNGRKYWMPLFDQYHLTVAFEHHDQTLKRTKLLKRGKVDKRGTLYLGDGGWGAELQYPPIQGLFNSYFSMLQGKVHFFWTMAIEKDKIIYTAVTLDGSILDRYVQCLSN